MPRLPATIGGSEPSLAACLRQDPTNAWMATPNSDRPGGLAPEVLRSLTVIQVVLGSWMGEGGLMVEEGAPP